MPNTNDLFTLTERYVLQLSQHQHKIVSECDDRDKRKKRRRYASETYIFKCRLDFVCVFAESFYRLSRNMHTIKIVRFFSARQLVAGNAYTDCTHTHTLRQSERKSNMILLV